MRILILGAGGIGGYFGGRLAAAGSDVSFLVRATRAERLRADGLRIVSPMGDAALPVKVIERADSPFDLILLSCKAYDLGAAIAAIRPAVGPGTHVLPLLNGLAHLDALDTEFGRPAVLGGLAAISVELSAEGTVRHLNRLQALSFGPRADDQLRVCEAVEAALKPASFDTHHSPDIVQEMWDKFAFITAASAITCLMRSNSGIILDSPAGRRLTQAMIGECEAVAEASGHKVGSSLRYWADNTILRQGSTFTASMLRDLEAGARIETDHLQGDMIARGQALEVETPLLEIAYCHLKAYAAQQAQAG